MNQITPFLFSFNVKFLYFTEISIPRKEKELFYYGDCTTTI